MGFPVVVILEDDKNRIKSFKSKLFDKSEIFHFTNVKDCFTFISTTDKKIDMIFLDHDLDNRIYVNSNEENTGYQMAKKIKEHYGEDYPEIIIHSLNPAGADNILSILTRGQKIPFPVLINSI